METTECNLASFVASTLAGGSELLLPSDLVARSCMPRADPTTA